MNEENPANNKHIYKTLLLLLFWEMLFPLKFIASSLSPTLIPPSVSLSLCFPGSFQKPSKEKL